MEISFFFFFTELFAFFVADEEGGAATCEEGLHGGALSQFDRRLSGVGGQSGVCAVVQEQPDYWQVVARHCVVERPDQRKETMSADLEAHKDATCARVTPPVSSSVEFYAVELEIVSITGNRKGHLKFSLVELFYYYGAILKNLDRFNHIPWSERGAEEHISRQHFVATSFNSAF